MTEYERIVELYEALRLDCFEWDSPDDCLLQHKSYPLSVQLPSVLEKGATTRVHLSASLWGSKTPEEILGKIRSLIVHRDYMRECGYSSSASFEDYGDGFEYVYDIPTESEHDLVRILKHLSFERHDRVQKFRLSATVQR